jgi:hypothetical protein
MLTGSADERGQRELIGVDVLNDQFPSQKIEKLSGHR